MKKHIIYTLLIVIALLQTACNKEETDLISEDKVHLQVTARGTHPDLKTDLFPSFLYLAEGLKQYYKEQTGEIFTDQIIELSFTNPAKGTHLMLEMRESVLTKPFSWQYTTGDEEEIRITLPVKWKYKTLRSWNKTEKIVLIWDVKINNKESGTLSQTFTCHDIRQFPERIFLQNRKFVGTLSINKTQGVIYPAAILSAYIDENNPLIDALLQEAIADGAIDQFDGYARGDKQIVEQLGAIWYILLKKGMSYGNHCYTTGYWTEKYIQNIRPINEIFYSHTGNCMEIPIILLSMCHRIGLKTSSFHVESGILNHMYMGIKNKEGETILFLNPAYIEQKDWTGKTIEQRIVSSKDFLSSLLEIGLQEHLWNKPYIMNNTPRFEQVDFDEVRRAIPSLYDNTNDNEE